MAIWYSMSEKRPEDGERIIALLIDGNAVSMVWSEKTRGDVTRVSRVKYMGDTRFEFTIGENYILSWARAGDILPNRAPAH